MKLSAHDADGAMIVRVEESRIDELSRMAANDPTAGGNPVPLDAAKLKGLFRAALAGTV